jgi:predicted PurR-regulated permease PerM
MTPEQAEQLLQQSQDIIDWLINIISGTFLLTGVIVGVLMMCIFFFFLKGAE